MSEPLISIAVITYNSSKYVLETLESIEAQTYKNIEVVISDDCSTDQTVAICKEWMKDNEKMFTRILLLTSEKNTGISPNANRALYSAKGEWIKFIAGDDILFPHAIESYVDFIYQPINRDAVIVVSSIQPFMDTIENKLPVWPDSIISNRLQEQLRRQLIGGFIKAPGVFMKMEMLNKFGGFNEKYTMFEDDPMWIMYLVNGYKFYFHKDVLVGYRMHSDSASNGKNVMFLEDLVSFKKNIVFPLMLENKFYLECILNKMDMFFLKKRYHVGFTFNYKIIWRIIIFSYRFLALCNRLVYGK